MIADLKYADLERSTITLIIRKIFGQIWNIFIYAMPGNCGMSKMTYKCGNFDAPPMRRFIGVRAGEMVEFHVRNHCFVKLSDS